MSDYNCFLVQLLMLTLDSLLCSKAFDIISITSPTNWIHDPTSIYSLVFIKKLF